MLQDIREAVVIFNPSAGRARALSRSLERARHILARQGIETELSLTTGPGAATEIARKAVRDQRQLVIACGGDGTLNEVVNGMAHSQVPLALLPAGTANVLAKEIGLPWNVEQASRLITGSSPRRIALGLATTTANGDRGRFFLSVAGAGPDGAIVNAVNLKLKARIGVLAYWAAGFQQLSRNFAQFRVTVGSKVLDATLIVVGRTKSYGGPFRITTEADLYRDEFELLICTTRSPSVYLGYVAMLWAGQLRKARNAHFFKAATVTCEPLASQPTYMQVDGEPMGRLPAIFSIVPDALTLVVPDTPSK